VGGGIAGTSTAIALRMRGLSVTLIERSNCNQKRIGETLHPQIKVLLSSLDLWDDFVALRCAQAPARLSSWGHARLDVADHIFSPYGNGWVVARPTLDVMLAVAAERRGVVLVREAKIRSCYKGDDGVWVFTLSRRGAISTISSDFAVVATGRSSLPLRVPRERKISYDQLVCMFADVAPPTKWKADDHRPLIEAVADGWWYSVLLPDGRVIVALMTDADLARHMTRRHYSREAVLTFLLGHTLHTKERLTGQLNFLSLPAVVAANTYCREIIADHGKLMVGDAAFAIDPLSGQGTYAALESGIRAAEVISKYHSMGNRALVDYASHERQRFDQLLVERAAYYRLEQRWPNSPFWCRRHNNWTARGNGHPSVTRTV